MALKVTAGYVTVTTAVNAEGSRADVDIPRGVMLPDDVPAEQREALLRRGDVERVGEAEPAEPADEVDPDAVPEGTIAAVLAWVDSDAVRARRALEAEQRKGDKARTTLVIDLTKIAEA